jgi:hypothetical protein
VVVEDELLEELDDDELVDVDVLVELLELVEDDVVDVANAAVCLFHSAVVPEVFCCTYSLLSEVR